MLTNFAVRHMPRAVKTAPDVFGLCGRYYRFEGDTGVCPRCGEYERRSGLGR